MAYGIVMNRKICLKTWNGEEFVIEKQFEANNRSVSFSTEGLNKGMYG
jgi:hypothetical protein